MEDNKYLEKWSKKLGKDVKVSFDETCYPDYTQYSFGKIVGENTVNILGYKRRFGEVKSINKYMTVNIQPFPSCCGMDIANNFWCQGPFTAEDYWEFLQLVLKHNRKPLIGIISNAGGYETLPTNKAIEKNAQFICKTRNPNYGSCVSTYMIYPETMKTYLSTCLDKCIPYGDWKE